MHSFCAAFLVGVLAAAADAEETANPIRKIVTMLQQMQVEIETEAEESKKMYEKFMCFCDSNIGQTTKEIDDGTELVGQLESEIKGLTGANAQIESNLAELETEMAENQKSVDEQAGVRKEEAAKFAEESTETKNSIAAIDKALPALKKGVSFQQMQVLLGALAPLAKGTPHEEDITSMLQATDASSSGSSTDTIIGILEQMVENFKGNLKEMIQDEEDAIAKFNQLIASKNLEISTAAKEKDSLKGQHAANANAASSAKMELIKAENALKTNTDRLVDLKKSCGDKTKEYDAATKGRQLELEAIGAAIKILNDDDALDLFKKTLPSPSLIQQSKDSKDADPAASVWEAVSSPVSFVQRAVRPASFVQVAAASKSKAKPALEPIVKLVGDMHMQLGAQQDDDDKQRDFCKDSISETEKTKEEKVGQVNLVSQFLKELSNEQAAIADQIKKLGEEIAAIDLAMKEATLQREKEKTVFTKQTAEQNAAIAIIEKAKEVLGKAFGPEAEGLVQKSATSSNKDDNDMAGMLGLSFVQTRLEESAQDKELDNLLLRVGEDAGLVNGVKGPDRTKQGAGIMAIMEEMKHDIELEVAELKHDEEESQADFDKLSTESSKATKDKKKEVTGREEAKAAIDEKIQIQTGVKGGYDDEVSALDEKLKALHEQCDFLLENYEKRKEARAQEMEGLSKSKAVLQGAKLDLAQTRNLRGQ
jgi:chromosome segregation ATPase